MIDSIRLRIALPDELGRGLMIGFIVAFGRSRGTAPNALLGRRTRYPAETSWYARSSRLAAGSSRITRCARTRAASTKVTSFIRFSACNGVLVRDSRTVQLSRIAESKFAINGGGAVRFQNVYRLRRYSVSPLSGS